MDKNKLRRIYYIIYITLGLGLFCLFYLWYIRDGEGVKCIFYEITKLYCPGCGMTRSFTYIFKLDFYKAFRSNIFGIPFFIGLLIWGIDFIICYIKGVKSKIKIPKWCLYLVIVLLLLYGVMRNIPGFEYLRPI